jgi:uncharacterized protein YcnI
LEKAQKKAEQASAKLATVKTSSAKASSLKTAPLKAPTATSPSSKSPTLKTEVAKPRAKRVAKPTRMKIVWEICSGNGEVVKTYPYAEKAAAEAELLRLSNAKREHVLRNTKVPME